MSLIVTRRELTALTALQSHQLARREKDGALTPITRGGRTGYPWQQVERLVCKALPITGRRIADFMAGRDPVLARLVLDEAVHGMRTAGRGTGTALGE